MSTDKKYLDSLRKLQSSRELSEPPLSDSVPTLLVLGGELSLPGNAQTAVVDVNMNILLLQAGKFERRCDRVIFLVLVKVHPGEGIKIQLDVST